MQLMSHSRWICSGNINDMENRLPPELFRKVVCVRPGLTRAELLVTAMGIYEARLNGTRVGDVYFCPGYTAYEHYVQFQRYEVSTLLREGTNTLDVTVANGWWLGTIGDRNNRYGTRRGLRAELHLSYADGAEEIIGSDEGWLVTQDTPCRYADFYNGETIDFTRSDERLWCFSPTCLLPGPFPEIKPHIGTFVREEQRLLPVSSNGAIFDFGQNHAGLLLLSVVSRRGAVITVRHAELLDGEGKLYTANLRGARQTLTLICGRDGHNDFSPGFTYMGFRYVELSADSPFHVSYIASRVLTSDCAPTGRFSCSDPLLNRLQENIEWSQRSNFLEIPTDCPQRDERMGWTGDIAVFAGTAAFNRDIRGLMRKWLYDLSLYQRPDGAIPVTIPEIDTYAPTREPIPIALWGDAATMVPWALWMAYGDEDMLAAQYDSMRACVNAELRAASATGSGLRGYIWDENEFQYGDWCAPGWAMRTGSPGGNIWRRRSWPTAWT